MKVYVLTHCAAEDNYTPIVFTNEEKAQRVMLDIYSNYVYGADKEQIFSNEITTNEAEIVWVDDTYDKLKIFEVEVEE